MSVLPYLSGSVPVLTRLRFVPSVSFTGWLKPAALHCQCISGALHLAASTRPTGAGINALVGILIRQLSYRNPIHCARVTIHADAAVLFIVFNKLAAPAVLALTHASRNVAHPVAFGDLMLHRQMAAR
jgi:hypothetical protein